jgi:hypothetical protein
MSYTPTIIIVKSDLHREEENILAAVEKLRPTSKKKRPDKVNDRYQALLEVSNYLNLEGFKIAGVKLVMVQPEFTRQNAEVRKLLDDLHIEFAVDH